MTINRYKHEMRRIAGVRFRGSELDDDEDSISANNYNRVGGGIEKGAGSPPDSNPLRDEPSLTRLPSWVNDKFWRNYYWFLLVTALIHLASGIATSTLIYTNSKDWPTRICASYTVWVPDHADVPCFQKAYNVSGVITSTKTENVPSFLNVCNRFTAWKHIGSIDPSWMASSFFYLSFAFQILPILPFKPWLPAWLPNYERYKVWLREGTQPLRFIEYSVSSSVMILVIALLTGNTDLWILLTLAACNWSIMIFGLLHEQVLILYTTHTHLLLQYVLFSIV